MEKEVADLEAQVAKLEKETEELAQKEIAKQNQAENGNHKRN
jgi:outer membrane murein-binding lipoprotein Lpp